MLVDDAAWPRFLAAATAHGLGSRIDDPLAFARRTRMLLLRHAPSGAEIDVSLGTLPFEQELVDRARITPAAGLDVPLPTPEDLIVLKAVAHRPRDLADIDLVLDMHPGLDRRRIRRWVRRFAEALDAPDIIGDLEPLLRKKRVP